MRQSVPEAKLGAAYEDVSFTTSDGLELHGWYVPSKNGAAVIAFPGRSGPQAHARMLARHGYGVLLFDRRGEGASDGDSNLFGWGGDKDILAAIEYLKTRPGRRAGPHRRNRLLRRRRADAADRGGDRRPRRRRLRGRRHAHVRRGDGGVARSGEVAQPPLYAVQNVAARRLLDTRAACRS